jgi:hypothetical protein
MAQTQGKTIVEGVEEMKGNYIKKTGTFFLFFKMEWWEKISEEHIGNDIHIRTTRPIRDVYLNGELIVRNKGI